MEVISAALRDGRLLQRGDRDALLETDACAQAP
jgi:hypothetical protein